MEDIYQSYAQTVFRYLLSLTRNRDLAEELCQETFYQALRSIHRYDETACKLSTWLCAIAKHQLQSYRRKHPPAEELDATDLTAASAESNVLEQAGRLELLKHLHACPEPYREVLYLRVFGNLSFREVGEITGRTENWARVTYYRGKERLRKELEET
jgi:RNA polymerase sigma-70 factor (ECF subfamily)